MLDIVIGALLVVGAAFALVGSIGLARLDDFYMRLHGPTKATTLGVGSMLAASAIFFSARGDGLSLHELLVTIFLFVTAPVSGHMMAKAGLHLRLPNVSGGPERTQPDGMDETALTTDEMASLVQPTPTEAP